MAEPARTAALAALSALWSQECPVGSGRVHVLTGLSQRGQARHWGAGRVYGDGT
jgi:hypothetical protein